MKQSDVMDMADTIARAVVLALEKNKVKPKKRDKILGDIAKFTKLLIEESKKKVV